MTHLNDYLIPCKNEDLAKAWTDGDPLGNGLPEVTSSDNGKVLTVINGSWGAGEASGGGILKVTLTVTEEEGNTILTLDHTWAEIRDALNLGYYVCIVEHFIEEGVDVIAHTPIINAFITADQRYGVYDNNHDYYTSDADGFPFRTTEGGSN